MGKITRKNILIVIFILTLIGGVLRFTNLESNPPSLTVDEVSSGFNSFSILKTGRDEYGTFLPLVFRSLNDFKPPLYIYLSTIPIYLFGLNEFSIRFISAIIGTLIIPLSFLLFKKITGKQDLALLGAFIFTISPWHIFYSRLAFESPVAMSLTMVGVWGFLKMIEDRKIWGVFSAAVFGAALFTYHSERIFLPLFIIYLIWVYRQKLKSQKKLLIPFFVTLGVIFLPLLFSIIAGGGATRVGMTLITNDPIFVRNTFSAVTSGHNFFHELLQTTFGGKLPLLFFFILNKFLYYLHPSYLFFQGLNMTSFGAFGLGLMYFFEIPFFITGLWYYLAQKSQERSFVLGWLFLGIIPAAITLDIFNPIRLLLVTPMIVLISAQGVKICYKWLESKSKKIQLILKIIIGGFIIWNLTYACLIFFIQFPIEKSEDYLYGSKQSALYAISQKDNYQEIVMDPVRGTLAPDIRGVPHLYLLFFANYDPLTYQQSPKRVEEGVYGFDKFTFREIDWRVDQKKKGTLFIGSPWRFTDSSIKPEQIKQKFYLLNGQLALMAVSP